MQHVARIGDDLEPAIGDVLQPLAKPVSFQAPNGTITWGDARQWVLFAGPDSFEDEGMVMEVAQELKRATAERGIPWIFKCSFDKANRTSASAFRGHGMKEGLKGLERVKAKIGCALVTDVHETDQVARVAEVAEVIQIPAVLSRQTDLIVAAVVADQYRQRKRKKV